MVMIDSIEKWTTLNIKAVGSHFVVKIDGVTTVDTQDTTYTEVSFSAAVRWR